MFFKFNDEIHDYQRFVRNNIKVIGNLIIIAEQLYIKSENKGFIDMLAVDLNDKKLVIIELKNTTAKSEIIGQSIKYYDMLMKSGDQLNSLMAKNNVNYNEINCIPKILLIVPDFDNELLSSIKYISDIEIDVIKFNAIQHNNFFEIIKEEYRHYNIIENNDDRKTKIDVKENIVWNFDEYIKRGVNKEQIDLAKKVISFISLLCNKKNKKFDTFFHFNRISIIVDGKVWGHIKTNIKYFNKPLEVSIRNSNIDIRDLQYNGEIFKFNRLSKIVKIHVFSVPTQFLEKYI